MTTAPHPAHPFALLGDGGSFRCDFPLLGRSPVRHSPAAGGQPLAAGDPVIVQRVARPDGSVLVNVFNTGDLAVDFLLGWEATGLRGSPFVSEGDALEPPLHTQSGLHLRLSPHQSRLLSLRPE